MKRRAVLCAIAGAPLWALGLLWATGIIALRRPDRMWALLVIVGIIAIYLLMRVRPVVAVSSLLLWRDSAERPASTRRLRLAPFWREPHFWARAAIAGLLGLALAEPVSTAAPRTSALVLVVDRGTTLNTQMATGLSRDQAMRQQAIALIEGYDGPLGLVLATAAGPRIWPLGTRAEKLVTVLRQADAARGWSRVHLPAALQAAAQMKQRHDSVVRIAVFTDNAGGDVDDLVAAALGRACDDGTCHAVLVPEPQPRPDVSLVQAPLLVTDRTPFAIEYVASRIDQPADQPVRRRLTLTRLTTAVGAERADEGIRATPGDRQAKAVDHAYFAVVAGRHSARVSVPSAGCWQLSLATEDHDDALAAGNTIHVMARHSARRVCVVADDTESKIPVLEWMPQQIAVLDREQPLSYVAEDLRREADGCRLWVFVDPKPHADVLAHPHVAPRIGAQSWLVIETHASAPQPVTRVTEEIPLLGFVEPRLLRLVPLAQLGYRCDPANSLVDVAGTCAVALETNPQGQPLLRLSSHWPVESATERRALGQLVQALLVWLLQSEDSPTVPGGSAVAGELAPRCPPAGIHDEALAAAASGASGEFGKSAESGAPGELVGEGVFRALPTPQIEGSLVRVQDLDPVLDSINIQPTGLPNPPLSINGDNSHIHLWSWLIAFAILWAAADWWFAQGLPRGIVS